MGAGERKSGGSTMKVQRKSRVASPRRLDRFTGAAIWQIRSNQIDFLKTKVSCKLVLYLHSSISHFLCRSMAVKHSQNKGVARHAKRARIEAPSKPKFATKRIASPHPTQSRKATTTHDDEDQESYPISEKGKGKEKEVLTASKPKTKRKIRDEKPQLPTSFKVVAGSYEKLLYGLEGSVTLDADSKLKYELKPTFIFPAHVSCIKAVAASPQGGKWLATGSADEIIKVWDLRRRKEIGGLMHHEGRLPGFFLIINN